MKYLKYLNYVLKHKWYVLFECFKERLYWRGITHDLSKFLPSEFIPYANHFYGQKNDIKKGRNETGYYKPTDTGDNDFDFAWLLHQKRNDHHWQYWVIPTDAPENILGRPVRDGECWCYDTMAATLRSVDVVAKGISNSSASIMLMGEGISTESKSEEKGAQPFISMLSSLDIPKDIKFSAITAIRALPITDIAPTEICPCAKLCRESKTVPKGQGGLKVLQMPSIAVKEMVCDWIGAGKAQGFISPKSDRYFETKRWYEKNHLKMNLHYMTRAKIESIVYELPIYPCSVRECSWNREANCMDIIQHGERCE